MRLSASIKRIIERHALADYPREACGLIVASGDKQQYVPCRNVASHGQDFRLPAEDYAAAEDQGQVLAVVHSHVDRDPMPTEVDLVSCEATGMPWHIVSVGRHAGDDMPIVRDWHSFAPSGYVAPLVGRTFHHGSLDCYGLIRDFFTREISIEIPDFDRPDDWWMKPEHGELYLENFEAAGFVRVDDGPRYGDVVLMQYRSDRTNHGGVYLGDAELKTQPGLHPVPGAMLHHAMPRLSERVMYAGYWRDITRMIVRHRDLL
ncbi:C40 family peptidase [Paracandidimonas soli]|uniref:Proteasome lid subunit RPN8/RPN11 n=1 Tax=Paracandidimonas soli TaxID=1917182 RepID=A0A4R3UYC1_9BURK|nr:Mov34/MPN/PAD-1 family protein [Paracandidimonas soli]TCU97325.1 proteasome lid subunit RPN8/RPN11 [Paracandidimonas soli]